MAQSLARLWTHLIFSTKNRFPFLNDKSLRMDMHAYVATVLRSHECETLIVGGVEDHIVIRYIERQEEHHKTVTFQDEYRAFLKAYRIEYDERYVWD